MKTSYDGFDVIGNSASRSADPENPTENQTRSVSIAATTVFNIFASPQYNDRQTDKLFKVN